MAIVSARHTRRWLAVAALAAATAAAAQTPPAAGEKRIVAGPGAEVVAAKCAVCHDLSHIARSRLGQGEWEDTIDMMVKRGLVITPDESKIAVDYLTRFYGPKGPPADAAYFGAATAGRAPDVEQLLAAHACTGCHAVDRRVVGPSFKEIAARYASQVDRIALLTRKLHQGSIGSWGQVPMPPMPQIAPADAQALLDYVLSRR